MALLRKEDVEVVPEPNIGEMGAVLGRGSRFEGKLTFDGAVRIDGEFVGDVVSDGHLIVGDTAVLEGTISVGSALVSGTVHGTLRTRGLLELRRSARVKGDLEVETLTVEKGAFFEGTVKMRAPGAPAPSRPALADRRGG